MWKERIGEMLPLLGHRNWILVVDKAFPLQTGEGITTVNTGENLIDVLQHVMTGIKATQHLRPVIHIDTELKYMDKCGCAEVEEFRSSLYDLLSTSQRTEYMLHDEIIKRINEVSKSFAVLILKTDTTIPYTSVFIELDCGYWDARQEKSLRTQMEKHA